MVIFIGILVLLLLSLVLSMVSESGMLISSSVAFTLPRTRSLHEEEVWPAKRELGLGGPLGI